MLAALADLGWTATFFLLGSQVRRFPDVARAVAAAGHEIAVHGDDHRNHLTRTACGVRADLTRAPADVIAAATGCPAALVPRRPTGSSAAGRCAPRRPLGLTPVLWTAWGRDWQAGPPQQVLRHVRPGWRTAARCCCTTRTAPAPPGPGGRTAAVLPLLAAELEQRGLAVRPLRDHLVRRG